MRSLTRLIRGACDCRDHDPAAPADILQVLNLLVDNSIQSRGRPTVKPTRAVITDTLAGKTWGALGENEPMGHRVYQGLRAPRVSTGSID
jgi:hypothetical protein